MTKTPDQSQDENSSFTSDGGTIQLQHSRESTEQEDNINSSKVDDSSAAIPSKVHPHYKTINDSENEEPSVSHSTTSEMMNCTESERPSFTISMGGTGHETGRTLYVYENDRNSNSEMRIKVVSMTTKEVAGDQEEFESSLDVGREGDDASENRYAADKVPTIAQQGPVENPSEKTTQEKEASELYSCEECDFSTERKYAYLTHWVLHLKPDAKGMLQCSECSYSTNLRYNLKTHLKRHANIDELEEGEVFRCPEPECSYTSMYKSDAARHAKKHKPGEQFRCFQCDFTSIYRQSLLHHVSSKHEGIRPYQCKLCSYSAARKQDLETHVWVHSQEKKYKCSMCKYETPYKHSFEAHMNKHKGIRPFQCSEPDCEFSTTTKANLKSHIKRHEQQLHCETCKYQAPDLKTMTNHKCPGSAKRKKQRKISRGKELQGVENEAGNIEYACEHCQFRTTNKRSFKQHNWRHEPGRQAPEKLYACEHCSYATGYKSSLKRHLARHSMIKPLKCGHCDYSAINMSQMHLHIAKHTGIKPYKCNVCSYASANKQHLVMHMSKHSDVRYKCDICGFTTAWPPRMNAHVKLHAQGKVVFPAWRRSSRNTQRSSVPLTTATAPIPLSLTADSNTLESLPVLVVMPENGENFQMVNMDNSGNQEDKETIVVDQNFDGTSFVLPVKNADVKSGVMVEGADVPQPNTDTADSALVIVTSDVEKQVETSSDEPQTSEQYMESLERTDGGLEQSPTPVDGTSQISTDVSQNAT